MCAYSSLSIYSTRSRLGFQSKLLLWLLSTFLLYFRQKLCSEPFVLTVLRSVKLNQTLMLSQTSFVYDPCIGVMLSQTSFVYGQSLHRCIGVSWSIPHSLHIGSSVHLRFIKLFAVRIFLRSKVQAKEQHFGSVSAFQIGIGLISLKVPSNWILYALFVVYSPFPVHRHLMPSSTPVINRVSLIVSQRVTNSETSSCVHGGKMWSIHLLFSNVFCTVIFFDVSS